MRLLLRATIALSPLLVGACAASDIANARCMAQGESAGTPGYAGCMKQYAPGLIFPGDRQFGDVSEK